jgi:tRNA(adenine34) deaminase
MPDMIGFGRSDKPKRCDFHSAEFHTRYMAELIERLDLHDIILVSPQKDYWLALGLSTLFPDRVKSVWIQSVATSLDAAAQAEFNAPFPDAGHRAAERVFASLGLR